MPTKQEPPKIKRLGPSPPVPLRLDLTGHAPFGQILPCRLHVHARFGGATSFVSVFDSLLNLRQGVLIVADHQLQFFYTVGGSIPASQTVVVSNSGGGALSWSASANASWLSASSSVSGITVSINTGRLTPASYSGTISVTAPGSSNSPQTLLVSLTVSAAASTVTVSSITNSASGSDGAVAPGEIVTIKGNGLGPTSGVSFSVDPATGTVSSTLAGTRVLFGTYAAPITYTSATQLNIQLSSNTPSGGAEPLVITVGNVSSPRPADSN